jgi:hypothetical protein
MVRVRRRRRLVVLGVGLLPLLMSVQPTACLAQGPWAVLPGEGGPVACVAFSRDGKTLAAGCWDGRVELWEALSARRWATLRNHTEPAFAVAFSGDGKTLAAAFRDGRVDLWDVPRGKARARLRGHTKAVTCVAFSPDDNVPGRQTVYPAYHARQAVQGRVRARPGPWTALGATRGLAGPPGPPWAAWRGPCGRPPASPAGLAWPATPACTPAGGTHDSTTVYEIPLPMWATARPPTASAGSASTKR